MSHPDTSINNNAAPAASANRAQQPPTSPPPQKTRLLIHKIRSTNFKSFCGTREIGPFNTHFTSIIGPNGSGKSNTLDMIQFIFSKKASSLRAKKLTELIYNSGGVRKDFCKVEIVFWVVPVDFNDNYATERTEDVVEEFTIGRSIRNKSKATASYYINRKKCTSQEVVTLLKKHDVDLDNNRFLILQGEVESIATKNNLELMDYLEEVIGSEKYKEPIEKLKKQLEELREEAATKNITAINFESSLKKKRKSFEGALKAAHDRLQIEHCKKEIALLRHQRASTQERDNTRTINILEDRLKEILAKIEKGAKAIEENEQYLQEERRALQETRKEREICSNHETSLRNKIQENTKSAEHKRKRINKFEKTVATVDEQVEALEKEVENSEKKLVKLSDTIDSATSHLETAEKSLQTKMRELQQKLKPVQEQIKNVRQKLTPFRTQIFDLTSKLDEEKRKSTDFEGKRTSLQQQMQQAQEELSKISQELDRSMTEYQHCESALRECATRQEQLSTQMHQIHPRLIAEKKQLKEAQDKFGRLQSEFSTAKTGNRVYQAVAQQNFSGFHERVGNLATIDPAYNTAINAVLNNSNNLVVENTATFKTIVKFLKENRIGTSYFENLETVTKDYGAASQRLFQAPSDAPRLFDLLNIQDARYRPIFYKTLHNTLVANDITRARELAFQTHKVKVVTLSGEVINPSGIMTSAGGPRGNALGSGGSRVTKEQVTEAQQRMDEKRHTVEELEHQYKQMEQNRANIGQEQQNLKTEVEKTKRHIDQHKMRHQQRERALKSFQEELRGYSPEALARIQANIDSLSAKLEQLERESTTLSEMLKSLEEEERKLKGQDTTVLEEKVQTLKRELESLQKDRSKTRQKKKSASQKIERIKKEAKDAEKNIASLKTEIETLEAQVEQFQAEAATLKARTEELTKKQEEDAEKLKKDEETHEANKKKLEKLKSKQHTGLQEVKNLKHENKTLAENKKRLEKELEEHARNLIETLAPIPNFHNPFGSKYLDKYLDDTDYTTVQRVFGPFKEYFTEPVPDAESEDDEEKPREEKKGEEGEKDDDDRMEDVNEETPARNNAKDDDRMVDVDEDAPKTQKTNGTVTITFSEEDIDEESCEKAVDKLRREEKRAVDALRSNSDKEPENMTQFVDIKKKAMRKRAEANNATKLRESCNAEYTDLCEKRKTLFNEGFAVCDKRMRQIFRSFTEEGDAALSLLDPQNPFENGVLFNVRPPGKSWREIQNLSGGEKTLSSLALVFGLHHYRPTPIYIMDEIDAALDFKNVSVIGNYIKEQATNAQFIVISLRNHMFDLADRLVGIYKTHDITKTIVIEPSRVEPEEADGRAKKRRRLSEEVVM